MNKNTKQFYKWLCEQPIPEGAIGHAYEQGLRAGWKAAHEHKSITRIKKYLRAFWDENLS